MKTYTLGIMTTKAAEYVPFPEAHFYAQIAKHAVKENFRVFVFFPESISLSLQRIIGFQLKNDQWVKSVFSYPDVVYDRVFYNASYYRKNHAKIVQFKASPNVCFLNRGLPSKWDIYKQLYEDPKLRPFLPPQELYSNPAQLQSLVLKNKSIIIKPIAGGFGRGVLRLKLGEPIVLEGRNGKNQYVRKTYENLHTASKQLAKRLNHKYLLQRYLELSTPDGYPYDVRIFTQKNIQGKWEILGKGVRVGQKNQLTSNIKGGGQAYHYSSFMQQQFPHRFQDINRIIENIGIWIPQTLEKKFSPLFELGIDVGVDQSGSVWIIEVNAKPGRKIFEMTGNELASTQAITGPLLYARYLLESSKEDMNDNLEAVSTTIFD